MRRSRNALDVLIAGLCGRQAAVADWQAVIALANHTLLTPSFFSSLASTGQLDRIPEDVGEYLRFIYQCNRQRNFSLRRQLLEAVGALNRQGIVPVLLKGAISLFLCSADSVPDRITSDLDIAVETAEEQLARACLAELGYVEMTSGRGMVRPQDAGILELRPYRIPDCEPPKLMRRHGLVAKIPAARSLALHWMMHDLLKEGDYWRGRVDFRHLHDLALLAQQHELDWAAMRSSLPDQTARNAFDTQLLALRYFFGVSVPPEHLRRWLVQLQHWRRVLTVSHPIICIPLRLAGNVAWGLSRLQQSGAVRRSPADLPNRMARILLDADIRSKL